MRPHARPMAQTKVSLAAQARAWVAARADLLLCAAGCAVYLIWLALVVTTPF